MKCYKCIHYYVRMVGPGGQGGYNPYPCCRLFEDTGRRPNVLTQECFEPVKKSKSRKERNK